MISATASGWLSLTPRSSRRRATVAAMATSNLSFSRGVRFMAYNPPFTIGLVAPDYRAEQGASSVPMALDSKS